ncbi:hypothetical protein AZ19_2797 [Bordetella bronchiseptica E012]|nr:hypothetical protein AZ19_2797 [Bordetella bronchiseptica E012]
MRGHQPAAQQGRLDQRGHPGAGDQQAEHPPRIAQPALPAGIPGRAAGQPRQVHRQHDGKRERARAHEGHDHLRPQHFVAHGDGAGHAVQADGQAGSRRPFASRGRRHGLLGESGDRAAPMVQPAGAQRGQQVQARGRPGAALHAQHGNQQEGRQERAGDGPAGIGRVQRGPGAPHPARAGRAQQHRQGAAHEKRRRAHQQQHRQPGQPGAVLLALHEERRGARQRQRDRQRQDRHAGLDGRVQAQRAQAAVGPAPQPPAAGRQAQEEGAERQRDGVHFHADDQRQLLDPQDLEYQRRGAGQRQQEGRRPQSGQRPRFGARRRRRAPGPQGCTAHVE